MQVTGIIDFVTAAVAASVDVGHEHQLYTVEDGLGLYLSVIRNLPAPHPPLVALYPQVASQTPVAAQPLCRRRTASLPSPHSLSLSSPHSLSVVARCASVPGHRWRWSGHQRSQCRASVPGHLRL